MFAPQKVKLCNTLHYEQPKNLICIEPACVEKYLICNFCTYQDHQSHQILPAQTFFKILSDASSKTGASSGLS